MIRLDRHTTLALDIDYTLISGPTSRILADWVKDNRKRCELHLVTFRTSFLIERDYIAKEFTEAGLDLDWFASLNGVPEEFYHGHCRALELLTEDGRAMTSDVFKEALVAASVPREVSDQANAYRAWKGRCAAETGCTVMVDDLAHLVEAGCQSAGVEFIDALTLEDRRAALACAAV